MKRSRGEKVIDTVIVFVSILVGMLVFKTVDSEIFLKRPEITVSSAEIEDNRQEQYIGKIAGSGIPKLSKSEELEEIVVSSYMTVEPKGVVATGVYSRQPWMNPYSMTAGKTSSGQTYKTGRRAADVTNSVWVALDGYQEYYLIRLQDDSYILAQFSENYRRAIEKGKETALLIGERKTNSQKARAYLTEICDKYGASTTYTLYMVDDVWEEEHRFSLFMIKAGIAAVVFLGLSVAMLMILQKIMRRTRGKKNEN